MTICQRIGATVAAWSAAGTLAVVNTVDRSHYMLMIPWILMALSIAITMSISLMIWRAQNDVVSDIRADREYLPDDASLRLVP